MAPRAVTATAPFVALLAGALALTTPPGTTGPLPFFYDLYTFRDEGGTRVIAAFAVPARQLEREREDGVVRYRFDVTLVLADTALRSVARTDDSVFVTLPFPLRGDHLLHTHVETVAPPSRATLQRVVMTDATIPGTGQLYTTPFPVPDYGGDALMLSDVVMGLPDADGGWRRGGVTLALLPASQLPEGAFDLYYEIYNLPAGHPYQTELTIEPVGGDEDDDLRPVRTTFSGDAAPDPDGAVGEHRRVEANLERGRYRLTVTVTDLETGRSARRSRAFQVRRWREGATLVPAYPRRAESRR